MPWVCTRGFHHRGPGPDRPIGSISGCGMHPSPFSERLAWKRRLQCPVCNQSATADGGDRDEYASPGLSALASKLRLPHCKDCAKLAVAIPWMKLPTISRGKPGLLRTDIDYCVVKAPRFTFEKFPRPMISHYIHEIGRGNHGNRPYFQGISAQGYPLSRNRAVRLLDPRQSRQRLHRATQTEPPTSNSKTPVQIGEALKLGLIGGRKSSGLTDIDPWFLHHIEHSCTLERRSRGCPVAKLSGHPNGWLRKSWGFSDIRLAPCGTDEGKAFPEALQQGTSRIQAGGHLAQFELTSLLLFDYEKK